MNKKGNVLGGWIDYILIFVIGIFGFIFLFTYLSLSFNLRDNVTIETAGSVRIAENLINEQRALFEAGEEVEIERLRNDVTYVNTYKQLPRGKG